MFNQLERELKLVISKEVYEKIKEKYEFPMPWTQVNTYFDTDSKQIKEQKAAIRIRNIDEKNIFTLKKHKDAITKYEFEKEIKEDNIDDISDEEVLNWMKEYISITEPIHPTYKISTDRSLIDLENAELCLDKSTYNDGIVDYEIEYEYKKDHDGITAFNEILKPFGLSYEKNSPSKIARAELYLMK